MMRNTITAGLIAALLTCATIAEQRPTNRTGRSAPRVVAVADIHGDYDAFVRVLQAAGIIDQKLRWSGGDSIFVQTGDYTDRGPKTRAVLDLLMDLQRQKRDQVVVLLGNHEVQNIIGDLRYVMPSDYASFVDEKSESRRKAAFQLLATVQQPAPGENEWMRSHPPGFIEHREAFGPNGKYGRWLRSLPTVARVGDTLFLHGGFHPQFATWTVEQINDTVRLELKSFDEFKTYLVENRIVLPFFSLNEMANAAAAALRQTEESAAEKRKLLESFLRIPNWLTLHPDGPLWFRGFAHWSDDEGELHVSTLAKSFAVTRFVVGHTVQPEGRITARFGSKVFLIDTGMLAGYFPGGRGSAVEILNGKVTPVYP
jgi:hypothetical protein